MYAPKISKLMEKNHDSFNFAQQLIKNRWNFLWIVLAVSLILVEIIHNIYRLFFTNRLNDFYNSYVAARALILGTPLYESGTGLYIYPPFYAFILTPLAHLSEKFAHLIWLGVNVSLIVTVLFLRISRTGLGISAPLQPLAGGGRLRVGGVINTGSNPLGIGLE